MAIAMHCNLRPSNATPVLIPFNYDVHAKFEVAQPFYCWYDTLGCDLTFDLEHMSILAVSWSTTQAHMQPVYYTVFQKKHPLILLLAISWGVVVWF